MEFQLKQKDKLLGTLRVCDLDFPWLFCKFESTEAFQAVKPLFDAALEFLDKEDWENYETAYNRIISLSLELIDLENRKIITEFWLHIRDNEASLRY